MSYKRTVKMSHKKIVALVRSTRAGLQYLASHTYDFSVKDHRIYCIDCLN